MSATAPMQECLRGISSNGLHGQSIQRFVGRASVLRPQNVCVRGKENSWRASPMVTKDSHPVVVILACKKQLLTQKSRGFVFGANATILCNQLRKRTPRELFLESYVNFARICRLSGHQLHNSFGGINVLVIMQFCHNRPQKSHKNILGELLS